MGGWDYIKFKLMELFFNFVFFVNGYNIENIIVEMKFLEFIILVEVICFMMFRFFDFIFGI